ncbi:hypothetical protein MMC14_006332 [Varicellaria rhodocarpa]|nr:hypothetical protein [Varicellaria rhodocarpa]
MSQLDMSGSLNGTGAVPERGTRRRKFAGYLKAANELRQSYQQSYAGRGQDDGGVDDYDQGIPGAFPDVAIARNGDEEMVLFPSYARRHVEKERPRLHNPPGASQSLRDETVSGDAEYWRREWEKYEDDNAVVDVDIRGWVYTPHRGPMTRKNRLLVGLARHLSGIPAPAANSQNNSRSSSTNRERATDPEAELVERAANSLSQRGRLEADVAGRGGYSEKPAQDLDQSSLYSYVSESRSPSPRHHSPKPGDFPHPLTNTSLAFDQDNAPGSAGLSKRASWNQPADMTAAELSVANANLMARLKPFLNNPLISASLTMFFYNDSTSQSRSTETNEAGHFTFRAALDFVPTHVRVLATPKLSVTEEVRITEPTGISVISDIDDTIKHSSIGSGAKEIFRNTFIRDLGDLTIEGVREWYTIMADMGVQMHYVSNSPWQLYPVLVSFFAGAGLPKGSFHLKQYTGMLQGIFEPVAERKKGTLDKILHDFPKRRFILIGDSGEADLELYTDYVVSNPGRILGVFIRDVTSSPNQGFFDSSTGPLNARKSTSSLRRSVDWSSGISSTSYKVEQAPVLPPRPQLPTIRSESQSGGLEMGNLIDLDDPEPPKINELQRSMTDMDLLGPDQTYPPPSPGKAPPPRRPSKPQALRSSSGGHSDNTPSTSQISSRKGPPPPPKMRQSSGPHNPSQPTDPSPLSQTHSVSSQSSTDPSFDRQGYRSAVRSKVSSAYNALPSVGNWTGTSTLPSSQTLSTQSRPGADASRTLSIASGVSTPRSSPPIPPRRGLNSYPAAAAQYATNRLGYGSSGTNSANVDDVNGNPMNPLSKKEELWRRRWERAKDMLEEKGVMLRSWRVGEDVADDAIRLIERAKREDESGGRLPMRWKSR